MRSDPHPRRPKLRPAALRVVALALACLTLAACVPTEGERVEVQTLTDAPSYYPHQTGARWEYLPNNAQLDENRVFEQVAGPSVLDGQVWILWQRVGRGIQEGNYRQYSDEGVFLTRRLRPGSIIDFDPPLQEFPPPDTLRVGANWGGDSIATVTFPEAAEDQREATFDLQYQYRVVDERTVTVQERTLDVYVVELTSRNYGPDGAILDEIQQQVWFAPYVGLVKTEGDHFLIDSNIFGAPRAP